MALHAKLGNVASICRECHLNDKSLPCTYSFVLAKCCLHDCYERRIVSEYFLLIFLQKLLGWPKFGLVWTMDLVEILNLDCDHMWNRAGNNWKSSHPPDNLYNVHALQLATLSVQFVAVVLSAGSTS